MAERIVTQVDALEVIDNRGMPTIRTTVRLDNRHMGWADVPCGSSTGSYEAKELRDGGSRYGGKGVRKAIGHIHDIIAPRLVGLDACDQRRMDHLLNELDGTPDKSKLGANAILGVSLAVAKAAAQAQGLPLYRYLSQTGHVLPVPQASLINGGLHAGNRLDVQEYCVMPVGADSFAQALQMLSEIFMSLKDLLLTRQGLQAINSSEDGGFAPPLKDSAEAMTYLSDAVAAAGYAGEVAYGLDLAATGFYDTETRRYAFEGRSLDRAGMIAAISELMAAFPAIVSLEDPLAEDDLEGLSELTRRFEGRMLIGDDFFATNIERVRQGAAVGAGNAMLCKVNQIGTVTEAMDAADFARRNGYAVVMSVRSGETEDNVLSDISVALNAGLFKTGGMRGSDRGTNYNRFLEIEHELGALACYAGESYRR